LAERRHGSGDDVDESENATPTEALDRSAHQEGSHLVRQGADENTDIEQSNRSQ
jgi:hypothetical protein